MEKTTLQMQIPKFLIWFFLCIMPAIAASQKNPDVSRSKRNKVVVTGYITDSLHRPIPGAALFVDGKKSGTYSNDRGFYSVKVKPDIHSIMAFSLLHGGQEVEYLGQDTIHFTLSPNHTKEILNVQGDGEEVVRTPASLAQNDKTSSISTLDDRKIKNHNYRTIYDMIRGEIPGIMVEGSSIIIRGPSSVNASSEALLVVDGAIVTTISDIHPGDVQSISALKGAAAAIYGSRGANGVIVIKLKGSH
jgi:TonB-dependent SusC/RagA subfamily outer membrane receptor